MKITQVETLHCDAGWRNYNFVKVTADDGVIGWSEYDGGAVSPGVTTVIRRLAPKAIGQAVSAHERIYHELNTATRAVSKGLVAQALGAIENALLDAKAKSMGLPCYELLGGKVRDRIQLYWSHCASWRINHPKYYQPSISSLDDVKAVGCEVRESGYSALKTNVFLYDEHGRNPSGWRPGFGTPFYPELNVDKSVTRNLRAHLEALRDGAGPNVELMLDLNFNAKTEGYLRILREIADIEMLWIEIDTTSAEALSYLRRQSPHPIASCETLIGIREFLPYLREQSMDVAIVDTPWNGVWQSMKIAAVAEAHEVNVAPHNFYGHLCTMQSAHFAAAVPNLRIMEIDVDRLAWDHEIFPNEPQIRKGQLIVPDAPGWGCDPSEEAIRERSPRWPVV